MKKMTIIGAGISGLTAGIYSLLKGYNVTIYEKNKFGGGCSTGWFKDGYYIDNCMHWLTGTNQKTKGFKEWKKIGAIDETSNLYQGEFFYRSIMNNESISLYTDIEKTKDEMIKLSPQDYKEINIFINTIKYLVKYYQANPFFNNHLHMLKGFMHYHNLNLQDLSNKFKHPLLKRLFIDFFPKEYSSLSLIVAYATFVSGNGKVLSKGSRDFSSNIIKRFTDLGGKLEYESEVTKINVTGKTVTSIVINNNLEVKVDNIIYTGDVMNLKTTLLKDYPLTDPIFKDLSNDDFVKTMSSFHVAFLVDKEVDSIFDTTIFDINNITIGTKNVNRLVVKNYSYLYPNKKQIVYQTFTPQLKEDYIYWDNLKKNSPKKYQEEKNEIAKKLQDEIIKAYPSLKNHLKILDCWTPLTYHNFYNTLYGSYMGIILSKDTLFKKYSLRVKNLNNLVIASYWNRIMGGLPVALRVGKEASRYFK